MLAKQWNFVHSRRSIIGPDPLATGPVMSNLMASAPARQIGSVAAVDRAQRPLAIVAALLAMLGVLSLAGAWSGGAFAATGSVDTAFAATTLDSAIQRGASRLLGLQPANPLSRDDDPDDTPAPPLAWSPPVSPVRADIGAVALPRAVEPAPRRRPLHGSPQSPRAPPQTV
jgi:hypothetical protein